MHYVLVSIPSTSPPHVSIRILSHLSRLRENSVLTMSMPPRTKSPVPSLPHISNPLFLWNFGANCFLSFQNLMAQLKDYPECIKHSSFFLEAYNFERRKDSTWITKITSQNNSRSLCLYAGKSIVKESKDLRDVVSLTDLKYGSRSREELKQLWSFMLGWPEGLYSINRNRSSRVGVWGQDKRISTRKVLGQRSWWVHSADISMFGFWDEESVLG